MKENSFTLVKVLWYTGNLGKGQCTTKGPAYAARSRGLVSRSTERLKQKKGLEQKNK